MDSLLFAANERNQGCPLCIRLGWQSGQFQQSGANIDMGCQGINHPSAGGSGAPHNAGHMHHLVVQRTMIESHVVAAMRIEQLPVIRRDPHNRVPVQASFAESLHDLAEPVIDEVNLSVVELSETL